MENKCCQQKFLVKRREQTQTDGAKFPRIKERVSQDLRGVPLTVASSIMKGGVGSNQGLETYPVSWRTNVVSKVARKRTRTDSNRWCEVSQHFPGFPSISQHSENPGKLVQRDANGEMEESVGSDRPSTMRRIEWDQFDGQRTVGRSSFRRTCAFRTVRAAPRVLLLEWPYI